MVTALKNGTSGLSSAVKIAYIALMTALLIGGQALFSAFTGVEIVTLLLVCFSYVFGIYCGVFTAVSFSLLRCFLWGFYPSVIILYLLYFPLLSLIFGILGGVKDEFYEKIPLWTVILVNLVLALLITSITLCLSFNLIKISALLKAQIDVFLWVLLVLFSLLLIAFDVLLVLMKRKLLKSQIAVKTVIVTALSACCTVFFTLLDDIITPLFFGMTAQTALTYFYASFSAMLPQTVCTVLTLSTLFAPITKIFNKAKKPLNKS